jgi:transcriptional regulator with XRE-family HTH domain
MDLGARLKDARGNIPRETVCKDIGIGLSTLTMYELNQRTPRDEIKKRLAKYYGISVEALFFAE